MEENTIATETAEEATDVLGWLLGVRTIFDDAQALRNPWAQYSAQSSLSILLQTSLALT